MASFNMPETFYEYFLLLAEPLLQEEKPMDELVKVFDINKTQLSVWLKKAVEDKKVNKLNKPVRYQWLRKDEQQGSLF